MSRPAPAELPPMLPLVSIVIPVYNQQLDFFEAAIDSALAQTYPNIEVVVSDNHSNNGLDMYLNGVQDNRLRVVKPPAFLPMVQNFQYAGDQAAGDWIFYLGSDDWLYPDCIETLVNHVNDRLNVVLVYSEVESVPYTDLNIVEFYFNRMPTAAFSAQESFNRIMEARPPFAWLQGNMIERKAYLAARAVLSGHIKHAFDVSLFLKMHELGDVVYVNKPTTKFRMWTAAEGKVDVDGSRLNNGINDLISNYALINGSPKLMSFASQSKIRVWVHAQARNLELHALLSFINGLIRADDCLKGLHTINTKLKTPDYLSQLLSWLVRSPQSQLSKPLLKLAHWSFVRLRNLVKIPF